MARLDTTNLVPVDPVHADPEAPSEPGGNRPPDWRPVAGDSAVWDG